MMASRRSFTYSSFTPAAWSIRLASCSVQPIAKTTRRTLLSRENVVTICCVEPRLCDDFWPLEPLFIQELLQIVRQASVGDLVLAREFSWIGRFAQLFEQLVCQGFFHAPFPSPLFILYFFSHSIANGRRVPFSLHQLRANVPSPPKAIPMSKH